MTGVNRTFMLKGMPVLRDVWPLNRWPPFRGLANVRHIDFPADHVARLKSLCGQGKATFITPNHPEFFTDWMIDKEVLARVSPLAASWATHGVVNGMGPLMQRFWLANNLIAQIPGNGGPARQYSQDWAVKGHGVLLHPEGAVGWHGDFVAPLLPGAVDMAVAALAEGRRGNPRFEAWVAPLVWKLVFLDDVEAPLSSECGYVERKLKIAAAALPLPQRIYRIYDVLLTRDAEKLGLNLDAPMRLPRRRAIVGEAYVERLAALVGVSATEGADEILRAARRRLRDEAAVEARSASEIRSLAGGLTRVRRLGPFAFVNETVTQEELAEHLKRIRNDYCRGTLRDTLNAFVPQPAGPRRAIIRMATPLAIHELSGSAEDAVRLLRTRMQDQLDAINADVGQGLRRYPNPFFEPPVQPDRAEPAG